MKTKKYKVNYTWHSGECFDARMDKTAIYEIEENNLEKFKREFSETDIDGSYCSINSIVEIEE